jgi:hypothetical protein
MFESYLLPKVIGSPVCPCSQRRALQPQAASLRWRELFAPGPAPRAACVTRFSTPASLCLGSGRARNHRADRGRPSDARDAPDRLSDAGWRVTRLRNATGTVVGSRSRAQATLWACLKSITITFERFEHLCDTLVARPLKTIPLFPLISLHVFVLSLLLFEFRFRFAYSIEHPSNIDAKVLAQ